MSTDPDDLDLPPRLAEALRDAYTHRGAIPADRERFLLSAARTRLHQHNRRRRLVRWVSGAAAGLAAIVAVMIWLNRPTPARPSIAGDINADGKLDIVDALVLARHLESSDPTDKTWDTNHDGQIDQKDVDTLASTAVRLQQGGLARRSLPKLNDLGIDAARVGFASANGISRSRGTPGEGRAGRLERALLLKVSPAPTFANANPTKTEEARP